MSYSSPVKKSPVMRASYNSGVKSFNNTPNTAITSGGKVREIPLEPDARYTISYVPGMSEHQIETGNTLEEARMKVVVLSCELERVNSYNYSLVRENEVLRVQANKSEREKDLETKLAIVLAENEKLNQIIEEIYDVYMSTKGYGNNEQYERRLAEVYQDLEEWKVKYNALESQTNVVKLQNDIKQLQTDKDTLNEKLARKDREVEAMRARLTPLEGSMVQSGDLQQRLSMLQAENGNLRRELESMKLQYGNAHALELKLADYDNKIKTVLAENEKLNNLVLSKAEEVKDLKARIEAEKRNNSHDIISIHHSADITNKRAVAPGPIVNNETNEKLQNALRENDYLSKQLAQARELEHQLVLLREENQRLNSIIYDREREVNTLKNSSYQSTEQQAAIERLSLKIKELIQQNESLNHLADSKSAEVASLYAKIRELESRSTVNEEANYKIHIISEERDRLREQLEQKKREVDDLYHRCSELNQSTLIVSEYKEKLILVTQENERLNSLIHSKVDEVETLRRKIVTLETTRVDTGAYEDKIRVLVSENQRLTDLHRSQAKEIDSLRITIHQLQVTVSESDELHSKLVLAATENERLIGEIESLKRKVNNDRSYELQSQINSLTSEKYRLEGLLADREREIHSLKENHIRVVESNVSELSRQNEAMKSAGVDQKRRIGELEGRISQMLNLETKVNYLNIELEKLHKDVVERENHIQLITQKLNEKEREIAECKMKLHNAENQRQYEVEEIRNRIQIEHERKSSNIRGDLDRAIAEKRDMEEKFHYMSIEYERLQKMVNSIKSEVDDWKNKYYQLQSSSDHEVDDMRRQFEALRSMTLQSKELQQKFSAERTAYETQIMQLNQIISDLERQVQFLTSENERVTTLSIQRLNVIEEMKKNSNEDSHRLEVYELRSQLESLKSSSYDVKQLALQYSTEKAASQSKINELTQLNASYKSDIEELRSLLEKRKADVDSLNRQNDELRKMCERLNKQGRSSTSSSIGVDTIEIMQAKISELEMSRNEFQRQAERNSVELTRKNRELVDKIQELDVLKLKYEEALANYQALNSHEFNSGIDVL